MSSHILSLRNKRVISWLTPLSFEVVAAITVACAFWTEASGGRKVVSDTKMEEMRQSMLLWWLQDSNQQPNMKNERDEEKKIERRGKYKWAREYDKENKVEDNKRQREWESISFKDCAQLKPGDVGWCQQETEKMMENQIKNTARARSEAEVFFFFFW